MNKFLNFPILLAISFFIAFISRPILCLADAQITGSVKTTEGKRIPHALVTVMNHDTPNTSDRFETVYADEDGNFHISFPLPPQTRPFIVRARHYLYQDFLSQPLSLKEGETAHLYPEMKPYLSFQQLIQSLPASSHFQKLSILSGEFSEEITSQCTSCHQMGNFFSHMHVDPVDWNSLIERMEGMGALLSYKLVQELPTILESSFQGSVMSLNQAPGIRLPGPSPKAHLTEWSIGDEHSFIHDIMAHSNGNIYAPDMGKDLLYELNPKSGNIETWKLPESELPLGGRLAGQFQPIGTTTAHHGPHSLQEAPDGLIWITNALSGGLCSFNIEKHDFKCYRVTAGLYPHKLVIDAQGRLWFTLALSNQVGMFDPKTEKMKFIDLPSGGVVQWLTSIFIGPILDFAAYFPQQNYPIKLAIHKFTGLGKRILPLPYGIDVSPLDGGIWYSQLYANKLGRIDPSTFTVDEVEFPFKEPRVIHFAKDGILWIPSYLDSSIVKFDTQRYRFTQFALPVLAEGQIETPYALTIHPESQDIWVTGGASDRMLKLKQETSLFTSYPLPTHVTFMRDVVFDVEGRICTSYSNLPGKLIEGGRPKILCIKTVE